MAEIRVEKIVIPTYSVGEPELSPLFLERRVNQGATGCIYPYSFIDVIGDDRTDKEYEAVFLENEYLKILVLPELGGRIQMAYDKIAGRHFVYHNTVIKPALIGLLGPWVSGGVEFNWPMHHRPTTYQRLDYRIVENPDGSKTLWVGEQERMFHLRAAAGYTIHPKKAFLKITAHIYNGTDLPRNFLWWANIAVRSDRGHQHVFPPDVQSVHFHAKSDVGRYPIMTGTYCGYDFSQGTDISYNENIPFAVSFMAAPSKYPFSGAYSHEEKAGVLHVADAGISPGKKLFTWGNSTCTFARGWMKNLTDSDGPYLELMAGVFTDNQPDFAWLSPGEEKRFDEYILPYHTLGMLKNANENGALKCEINARQLDIGLYVTSPVEHCTITVFDRQTECFSQTFPATPEKIWSRQIELPPEMDMFDLYVRVTDTEDAVLLDWRPDEDRPAPLPRVIPPAKHPHDIRDNDELYLTGLHIEQYLHATYRAEDYYLEALKRDRTDSRCNMAMGRLLLSRCAFKEALAYLQAAWEKFTLWNQNPYDGEISFLLGLCRECLGDFDAAHTHYYKSVWNGPWQAPGYFALARLEVRKGNFTKASEFIEKSLAVNGINRKARHLAVVLNRKRGRNEHAIDFIQNGLREDPIDFWLLYEHWKLTQKNEALETLFEVTRKDDHTFLELAVDYARLGMDDEAAGVLSLLDEVHDPMVYYHQAYYLRDKDPAEAMKFIQAAEEMPLTPYFPNRLEDIAVLEYALGTHEGYKANYLLGSLLYDKRRYEQAMQCWQRSVDCKQDFAPAWRNLAIGTFNKRRNAATAREQMETAVRLAPKNARFIAELNELYINTAVGPEQRLKFLEQHESLLHRRDDLKLEHVCAVNLCGRYEEALALMNSYTFHPWECKEGIIGDQYVIAKIFLGVRALTAKDSKSALELFEQGMHLQDNLGEDKLSSATDNDLKYFAGLACERNGDRTRAREYFTAALECDTRIHPAVSLVAVSKPDYIFFRGLAFIQLGDPASAARCFNPLIDYGIENMDKEAEIGFLEIGNVTTMIFNEDLNRRNRVYCHYLQALGMLGHGRTQKAREQLTAVLALDPNHSRAVLMQALMDTSVFPFFESLEPNAG